MYREIFAQRNLSRHTCKAYLSDCVRYLAFLEKENIEISRSTNKTIRKYLTLLSGIHFNANKVDDAAKTGYSRDRKITTRTQARHLASLRALYKILNTKKIIDHNPATATSLPRLPGRLPARINANDQDKIFNANDVNNDLAAESKNPVQQIDMPPKDNLVARLICEILYSSGMRISEMLSLDIGDVIDIPDKITIKGKRNKYRLVFFGGPARVLLKQYLLTRPQAKPQEALFINKHNLRMNDRSVRHILEKIRQEYGISKSISPHKFRHSFATDLLNEGADIRAVQELLGHASLSTTQIYTKVSKDLLRQTHRNCHPHGRMQR